MAVQLADGRVVMSGEEEQAYLANNQDVVLAISQGQFRNAADHFNRYGKDEGRGGSPDTEDLDTSVVDSSGFLYTNNMDINNPLADPLYRELTGSPDPVSVTPTGGTNVNTGGTTTFNLADIPSPDLTPVTTAVQGVADQIGPALPGQTNLFAGQAGIMSGQQGIRDIVTPLGEQVTGIGTQIGTADTDAGQTDLFAGQAGIQAGIGQAGTGQTDLFAGQRGIMSGIGTADTDAGQTDLFAGQAGLTTGQAGLQTGQTGLQTGQEQLGTQIGALGTAAVTDAEGTVTQQPTGLFEGQAGLMSGQTGLGTQLTGISTDLAADIQDQASRLGGQIGDFRTAAEQYQRGATTQRGDLQGTQRAGQANLQQQIQGVGQGINRQAEALARQRQQETSQFQTAQAPLQQAISNLTSNNQALQNNLQVGPMGPVASDPRDALIQQLLTRNASLMNNRPV